MGSHPAPLPAPAAPTVRRELLPAAAGDSPHNAAAAPPIASVTSYPTPDSALASRRRPQSMSGYAPVSDESAGHPARSPISAPVHQPRHASASPPPLRPTVSLDRDRVVEHRRIARPSPAAQHPDCDACRPRRTPAWIIQVGLSVSITSVERIERLLIVTDRGRTLTLPSGCRSTTRLRSTIGHASNSLDAPAPNADQLRRPRRPHDRRTENRRRMTRAGTWLDGRAGGRGTRSTLSGVIQLPTSACGLDLCSADLPPFSLGRAGNHPRSGLALGRSTIRRAEII